MNTKSFLDLLDKSIQDQLKTPDHYFSNTLSGMTMTEKSSQAVNYGNSGNDRLYGTHPKMRTGHVQSWPAISGMRRVVSEIDLRSAVPGTIALYKNGGEALRLPEDYVIGVDLSTGEQKEIILKRDLSSTDFDLELRCQVEIDDASAINGILIFPRTIGDMEFSDDELQAFLPEDEDIFDVAKLLKHGNKVLVPYSNLKAYASHVEITALGIVATIRII